MIGLRHRPAALHHSKKEGNSKVKEKQRMMEKIKVGIVMAAVVVFGMALVVRAGGACCGAAKADKAAAKEVVAKAEVVVAPACEVKPACATACKDTEACKKVAAGEKCPCGKVKGAEGCCQAAPAAPAAAPAAPAEAPAAPAPKAAE